ncbi:MAG: histidine kinase [Desulfobacteraceae bacterium 4572_19]|nr:MAG: histidine kinase [Desulfobacteraceae bacterium 4572_19]
MAKILIVDDEDRIRSILKIMLISNKYEVDEASDGNEALSILENGYFDMVISDIRMDGMDGKELLSEIKARNIGCPVVFITAFATLESAVEVLRLGASDYLVKPFEEKQVILAVERALGVGKLIVENAKLKQTIAAGKSKDIGVFASSSMLMVKQMAEKVGQSDATVLITGESGTGKEVVANLVYRASSRSDKRFVAVNCAAISAGLVESELFGHEKGSFTGANQKKEGKFEYADGGTLFLDEVGDLPLEAQAKLLRAIQEKCFQRVGGNREIPVNTRLICATNQDLKKLVNEKKFRNDLYFRLAVFPINILPLRERKPDIVPLSNYFIKRYAELHELGGDLLTPGAVRLLKEFPWPGNARELANTIERALILKSGALPLTSDDLFFLCLSGDNKPSVEGLFKLPPGGINFDDIEREIIRQAMAMTSNNQSAAARLLGLTRARFRTFLKLTDVE